MTHAALRPGLGLAASVVLLGGCGAGDGSGSAETATASSTEGTVAATTSATIVEPDWPEDVAEVYRRAEATLVDMGLTYVTIAQTNESVVITTGTRELWLDPANDRYREQNAASGTLATDGSPTEFSSLLIGTSDALWQQFGPVSPIRCHDVSVATSALLGCRPEGQPSTVMLERSESVDGVPTVVLVTTGTISGSDSFTAYTERLVVDATTGLPIRSTTEGEVDYGQIFRLAGSGEHDYEVLDPAALPDDWFDPASGGLGGPGPVELPADIAVPWLTEQWSSEAVELPPLVLARSDETQSDAGLYDVTLTYGAEADRYGAPMLLVYGWARDDWEAVGRPVAPCETLTVDGREIRVQCVGGTAVSASVFDGDRVAEIQAPATYGPAGTDANPFATRDALVEVASAIEWREPAAGP